MKTKNLIWNYLPALIMVILWLDGGFYPIILLPLLYIRYIEKRGFNTIGFQRTAICYALILGFVAGAITVAVYFPIFSYYQENLRQHPAINLYDIFTDVVWYPLYEEITYRGFLLSHLIKNTEKPKISSLFSNRIW